MPSEASLLHFPFILTWFRPPVAFTLAKGTGIGDLLDLFSDFARHARQASAARKAHSSQGLPLDDSRDRLVQRKYSTPVWTAPIGAKG